MSGKTSHKDGSRLLHILIGGLSFGLLATAFAPLSWAGVVFFATAPWFAHAAAQPKGGYWWGFSAGMIAWGATLLCWISSLAGAAPAGMTGWIAVSFIFLIMATPFGWAFRHLVRRTRWPLALIVPLVMTAFDATRRFASAGIAWHDPGYVLHEWTQWIQVADIARVYPLNFFLWSVNGLIADLLLAGFRAKRRVAPTTILRSAIGCAIFMGAILAYGSMRMTAIEAQLTEGPKICGVQPNISQAERLEPGVSYAETRYQKCLTLMEEAARVETDVDLFVWPETSFFRVDDSLNQKRKPRGTPLTAILNRARRETQKSVATEFRQACAGFPSMPKFLIGLVAYDDMPQDGYDERGEGVRERNSAILLEFDRRAARPNSFLVATQRADKQKLVPFGEYIPFPWMTFKRKELASWVEETAGYLPSMSAGKKTAIWNVELGSRKYQFGVNICYEVVFPEIFADARREGAEFIINTSNDAWYDDSAERDLCTAQIRFRAVENRLSMFRLSNTGISTFVDPLGRTGPELLEKNEKGTLSAKIALGAGSPPAVEGGLWAERILVAVLLLSLILTAAAKAR